MVSLDNVPSFTFQLNLDYLLVVDIFRVQFKICGCQDVHENTVKPFITTPIFIHATAV